MEPGATVTVQAAAELTGARPATIRAAVRRGAIAKVDQLPPRHYGKPTWLLDYSSVMAWRQAAGLPAPLPADPLALALDGSLMVCLDRQLAMAALRALEAERRHLIAERRRVAAARAQLLARR